jgi:adenylate cyclase
VACFLALYGSRLDDKAEKKRLKAKIDEFTLENNRLIQQFIEQLKHVDNPLTFSLTGVEISEKLFGACLVSDIQEFVGIADTTPPETLLIRLREYFKVLGDIISTHGGKIANIAGDGMVAIWIDPAITKQQQSACLATVAMKQAVDQFNSASDNEALITRFGLHEGEFAIGRVTSDRLEDNLFGDAINTASRIEGVNKVLGTRILASASIAANVSALMVRPVGSFLLKGKHHPIDIVEIAGTQAESNKTNRAMYKLFNRGLKAFRKGQWQQALAIFKKMQVRYGYDGPAQYYAEQFANQEKPPSDWPGYIKLESK